MTFLNNKYWNMYQESFYFIAMQSRLFLLKHQKYQRSKNATIENYITWIANYLQIGIALKTDCMQIQIVYRNPTCEKEIHFDIYPSVDDLRKCNSIFQVFASFTFPSLYFKTDSKFLYCSIKTMVDYYYEKGNASSLIWQLTQFTNERISSMIIFQEVKNNLFLLSWKSKLMSRQNILSVK